MILQWQSDDLSRSLSSFDNFCELVGLGGIQHYISARGLHQIQDWPLHPLDEEGKLLQLHMQSAIEVCDRFIIAGIRDSLIAATSASSNKNSIERQH